MVITLQLVPCLTDKDVVRERISKIKNIKAAAPLGLMLEMMKLASRRRKNEYDYRIRRVK